MKTHVDRAMHGSSSNLTEAVAEAVANVAQLLTAAIRRGWRGKEEKEERERGGGGE